MAGPSAAGAPSLEGKSPYELRLHQSVAVPELDVRAALASGDVGFLHSFTTGSAVDGPGIRVVAWTTSCMFRCRFCHNPDTWTLANGMAVPLAVAVDELRKYAAGLKVMKGGFTLSGGEPLMQHRFAARLFREAKQLGVHTAIETNGFYSEKLSDAELADIDLVILDMKGFTPAQHQRVTGVEDNARVLEFGRRLAAQKRPMWLRYVFVPGLTDVDAEMAQVADFAASLGVVERAEILPFHQMGRYKWERLGLDYALADTAPPTQEAVTHAVGIFRAAGLQAH
ncbi:pyruvate formate-lyase-activating protein [Phenylobacterium sp. LjRoot219]|uniref:pyruvate formate-lyase-activating protein n=1 Tax=Phenylobacterium sp. LjRoot219 TaxID=3342283 RepID=UPI003ECE92CA